MFELYPYGIMLLDADGAIVDVNDACRKLLGGYFENGHARRTCCELFSCRAPGGSLEGICLTELATGATGPLAEMRVDVGNGAPVTALWITAAPFESDSARILLQLRPGDKRDRRRWRSPHWTPPQQLEIFTLGRTLVNSPQASVVGSWLNHRAGELLKYLICERSRAVQAEEIAEALWPGGDPRMVNNVRHFVHALRGRLEPDRGKRAPSRFILSDVGGYRLNPETVTVDADHFERGVRTGLKCMETGDADAANIHLVEALRLYGGDFLAEERYALWTYAERDRLRGLAGQALAALSEIRLRANDVEGASHYIDRLADMHPFDPEVQRSSLMIALRLGRHTLARNRYQALRRRLMEEFGSEPAFSLRDLMVELENGSELGAARGWT